MSEIRACSKYTVNHVTSEKDRIEERGSAIPAAAGAAAASFVQRFIVCSVLCTRDRTVGSSRSPHLFTVLHSPPSHLHSRCRPSRFPSASTPSCMPSLVPFLSLDRLLDFCAWHAFVELSCAELS